ncbi:CatB-related O-acetyltransferase [Flagellimonas crocea]|uniref:CatB-related O-acetyltransferase n=1 Tax=Flagellimonas crocea TaxID=3067311 RepID=UPI00296ED98F|nr:CatB-related O-acetyltransferase [Muricauda sp. DH64]
MLVYKKNSKISKKSKVLPFSKFTNSSIDDYSYVGLFGLVNNTKIGKFCSISMNFKSGLGQHPVNRVSTSPIFYSKKFALYESFAKENSNFEEYSDITIGHDVWIGADVLVMDGVNIGNGAIVASKAVVTKDVPSYAIVGGIPAKIIKYRFSEDIITALEQMEWWNWSRDKILENGNLFNKEDISLDDLKTC